MITMAHLQIATYPRKLSLGFKKLQKKYFEILILLQHYLSLSGTIVYYAITITETFQRQCYQCDAK